MANIEWKTFQGGRAQTREICQNVDLVNAAIEAPPPIGAMEGIPTTITLGTTRTGIIGFPNKIEGAGFDNLVDPAAGTVTLPEDGVYEAQASIMGIINGAAQTQDGLLFLRSSIQGDTMVAGQAILPSRTDYVGLTFNMMRAGYSAGEVLSLWLDATANIGDLMFWYATFQVERRNL